MAVAKKSPRPAQKSPVKKPSFAALVRRLVAEAAPSYRFVETTGGSGPLVSFERRTPTYPRLREQIVFQKGLHGASWFRVNLFPMFVGDVAGGSTTEHVLWEGEQVGRDVAWKTSAELEAALGNACATLAPSAARFFAPFEAAYARLDKLLGHLVVLYADWLRTTGAQLPDTDFVRDEASLPAFASWKAFLEKKKLLAKLPTDVDTTLWRFWHGGRPMRESDYQKGRYYDCSKCGAYTSFVRGRLVKKKDPVVGSHYVLVCKKH